jgi:YVTN family beta-propeller protein
MSTDWRVLSAMVAGLCLGVGLGLGTPGCSDDSTGDDNNNTPVMTCEAPAPPAEALRQMGEQDGMYVLPGGRALTPAGLNVEVGGFPMDVRTHPIERVAYVSNSGYALRVLQVLDIDTGEVLQQLDRAESFYGLVLNADATRLYAAGGDSGRVDVYDIGTGGLLTEVTSLPVVGFPAGVALSEDGSTLYVAQFGDDALAAVDLGTGAVVDTLSTVRGPYSVAVVPGRDEVYVTCFADDRVAVIDLGTWTVAENIRVGGNPLGLAVTGDGATVYVTVANADSVSMIDTATRAVLASQAVGEPSISDGEGAPLPASSPSGLALDEVAGLLFVTRAADNAVALFDTADLSPVGAIPVGWYPTAIALADGGDRLVVTNGKGVGTGPLLGYGFGDESGKEAMTGTVSLITLGDVDLTESTARVEQNVRRPSEVYQWDCEGSFGVPTVAGGETPIEHIVLIVRENKTYDVVLGDLETGDGDPSLVLYGEDVTPNLHALARQFANHDNFYDDSETSVQGHLWLTASFANDYMERIWLEHYRDNGFDNEAPMDQGQPGFGTWFTHLIKHGVDFTNYGEVVGTFGDYQGVSVMSYTDLEFPGVFYNMDVRDVEKAEYVAEQLVDNEVFPPFVFVLLPNDHTKGTHPGELTPEAMINDNDTATGLLVDRISHSRFWQSTAIFIVEDDPQIGADHVDYHRSICIIASPWAKHGYVSSVHTSFPSLFRTFELILGIPPMNRYDALATPFWDSFARVPDFTPYDHIGRTVPDSLNSESAPGAEYSQLMDFSGPDRNPELGVVLWWARRGAPPPGSRIARELAGEIPSRLHDPYALQDADADADDDADDLYDAHWRRFYQWLVDHPDVKADLRPRAVPPRRLLSRWRR